MGDIIIIQRALTVDCLGILKSALVGRPCTSVNKAEYSWHFGFGSDEASLALECPWRLRSGGSIAYGYEDDGQKFGLPEPVDGVAASKAIIGSSSIASVEIQQGSGDLSVEFENGVRLESFNDSSGYEGWTFSGKGGFLVVAQGGGNLAAWDPTTVSEEFK